MAGAKYVEAFILVVSYSLMFLNAWQRDTAI
jgi:hypothetical protein